MKRTIGVIAAFGLAAGLAGAAAAQQVGAYRMDPNAPLKFSADAGDAFNPQTCTSRLKGRVELLQDRTRVRTQELVAYHPRGRDGCGSGITRWEAKGEVFYVTPEQRIRADAAVYDNTADTATFTGNVVAVQGENVTTTELLVVDLDTNAFRMQGRVQGVIYPEGDQAK